MKRYILVLLVVTTLVPAVAHAGPYKDAKKAFDQGDLKTAIELIFESARSDEGVKESRNVFELMDRIVREATYRLSTNPEYKDMILSRLDALPPGPMGNIEGLPALKQAIEALRKASSSASQAPGGVGASSSSRLADLKMDVLYLDGKSSFVELPRGIFDQLGDATVEAWVKWERFNKYSHVFDFGREKNALLLQNEKTSPKLQFVIVDRKGDDHSVEMKKTPISMGTWTHVIAVCGSQGMGLYINGELVDRDKFTGGLNEVAGGSNFLGRSNWPNDEYFQGHIAELRVWNGYRSQGEILSMRDRLLTGQEPGLVAYWSFNKAEGVSVPSGIPGGPAATLVGNARLVSVPAIAQYLAPGELDKTAEEHYQAGVEAQKRADYQTAVEKFQEALKCVASYKDCQALAAECLYLHGVDLVAKKDYKNAVYKFRLCQKYAPGYKDSATQEQEAKKAAVLRIAVMPFSNVSGKTQFGEVGQILADQTISNAVGKNEFLEFVTREYVQQLLQEQAAGQTGVIDENTAAKIGKVAGIHAFVFGKVLTVTPSYPPETAVNGTSEGSKVVSRKPYIEQKTYAHWTKHTRQGYVEVNASFQVIDVEKGTIVKTASISNRQEDRAQWVTYSGEEGALDRDVKAHQTTGDRPLEPAEVLTNKSITKLAAELAQQLTAFFK